MSRGFLVVAWLMLGVAPALAWPWQHDPQWVIVRGDAGHTRVVAGPFRTRDLCERDLRSDRRNGPRGHDHRTDRCVPAKG